MNWRSIAVGTASIGMALGLACRPATPADADASGDDPIEDFRRRLADPTAYPIRSGDEIDEVALRKALLEVRTNNLETARRRFDSSAASLPATKIPPESTHTERLAFELPDEAEAQEGELAQWVLHSDAKDTAHRVLTQYLAIAMVRAGFTTAEVGTWLAFLFSAEPIVGRCERSDDALSICVDYGGLDVFVVELATAQGGWVGRRIRWLRRNKP